MLFIFDMGGVVTNTFRIDSLYNKLNISKETFFKICKVNNFNIWNDLETGKIDSLVFWKKFNENANLLNLNQVPFVRHDLFRLTFQPTINKSTVDLIIKLKNNGHRVVCGTNTIQSHWENHMERGDYSYFDQTYASNKIGIAKPDSDFFNLILEAEGYKACDSFFTDDKEENCIAAGSLGIHSFQFTNSIDYEKYINSILKG